MPPRVRVSRVRDTPPQARPQRRSHYEILINSNYRPTGPEDQMDMENRWYSAIADAFENEYPLMLNWFTPGGRMALELIDSVEAPIRVETGQSPRGMRVHAHMRLDIRHRTRIQLDHTNMRRVLARHFLAHGLNEKVTFDPETGKGIYITYKLLRNPADAFEEYQRKKAQLVGGPSARSIRQGRAQLARQKPEPNTGARTPKRRRTQGTK